MGSWCSSSAQGRRAGRVVRSGDVDGRGGSFEESGLRDRFVIAFTCEPLKRLGIHRSGRLHREVTIDLQVKRLPEGEVSSASDAGAGSRAHAAGRRGSAYD
jgi:hypothetical protein